MISVGCEGERRISFVPGGCSTSDRKLKSVGQIITFRVMLLFLAMSMASACLTRVTPGSQPLQGNYGNLKVNLTSCWKPCFLPFTLCYPLCPPLTLEEARLQLNLTKEVEVQERARQLKHIEVEGKRRLSIR